MNSKYNCLGDICSLLAEVTCYHRITTDFVTGHNPPYHRHDVYEIYLFIRGNAKMYIEQNCYKFSPGDFIVIGPDKLHRNIVTDNTPYERIGIYFPENILKTLSSEQTDLADLFRLRSHDNSGIIRLSSYNLKEYIRITDRYIQTRNSNESGCELMSLCIMMELLLLTNRLYGISKTKKYDNIMPRIVIDSMKYIDENINSELTLDKISVSINYSPNYISSEFKKHTGLSLREYILDKRIEYAKKLLVEGKNVSDACLLSGFNDYSNFIRSFKKKTGISPGHYTKPDR
ncbi:MAG: AraC family transcriptional regulator [Lachnospiraceae bacterium]|nr:AraC family transcriptional regulator [Lachnospiraceae bacterium]